jgi:hypothetical protein
MITFFPGMRPETRVKKEVILLTDGQYGCDSESEVVAASRVFLLLRERTLKWCAF